jgi:hypothetical protein
MDRAGGVEMKLLRETRAERRERDEFIGRVSARYLRGLRRPPTPEPRNVRDEADALLRKEGTT